MIATKLVLYSSEYIHQIFFNKINPSGFGSLSAFEVYVNRQNSTKIQTYLNWDVFTDLDYQGVCKYFEMDKNRKVYCGSHKLTDPSKFPKFVYWTRYSRADD